jgi:hypothetical protein
MKRGHGVVVLSLVLGISACASVDRSIFDPRAPVQARVLPLEIHIIDPNVDPSTQLGDEPVQLLPTVRISEARYIIKKDFGRNVFEPGDPRWGHLVVRVGRSTHRNWGWFVASTCSLYVVNLFGLPVVSETSEVTLDIEILDAQRRQVSRLTAKGTATEYAALYWGRPVPGVRGLDPATDYAELSGAQMEHAEALRGALDDAKRQLETSANNINARLRAARTS